MESILKGKRVLITAGPTREYLDPVRFITNESSGKMGYAIAEAFYKKGEGFGFDTNKVSILIKDGTIYFKLPVIVWYGRVNKLTNLSFKVNELSH